jgi:tetratricopeptide (TPR) repeat protein
MSLTTVAATIDKPAPLGPLPPSRPERFLRSDFIAGAIVFLVTLGVYIATLAPNVTLEDSGELITAAAKFGVPHPPGYPLWTMTGFLISHLFSFGNLAWRVNLLSALIGAAANAVLALLVCHSGRWLLQRWAQPETQPLARGFSFYGGILAGLVIGFSDVMWGQAVITAVHGTLSALFVNLVVLAFYRWMLEPQKVHRLIITVFIFALGLTNHHTLIQIIPALIFSAVLLRSGKFWSMFLAIALFGLSILVYLSWLSADTELHLISFRMAWIILGLTALVAFYYLKEFRLRLFLIGALVALLFFAYGNYILSGSPLAIARHGWGDGSHFWLWGSFVHPGWLQISTGWGVATMLLAALATGLLFSCNLDRRVIIGAFAAGWVGLTPYAYESFASSTHPPMNWGFASERAGFYYAVARQQYPMSLPNLIKKTIGSVVQVTAKEKDVALGRPDYLHRLILSIYYYGDNFQADITVPLICLALAMLIYLRRCDWPQVNWLIFLALAFVCLAFLLQFIEPQESFDFERNLQYKVFHLSSHCIFIIFVAYGAMAALTYLCETWPEWPARFRAVSPAAPIIFLSLLPFYSNVDRCNQAGHWFGWDFGTWIMQPMDRNAVYYGGSDPGRFVPTYMAFVESQQDDLWKRLPGFDRRDVTVITQNALCDNFYCHYIRDQYDPRFRPASFTPFEKWLGRDTAYPKVPVTCISEEELTGCWDEYEARPDVTARMKAGGPILREGTNDVFDVNGIVARKIFEKNKKTHTFYLEQSVAIDWMYPYLLPWGLIFKMNPEPLKALPPEAIAADRKYWDDLSARLLQDPGFRLDDHATDTFAKLAAWHADLYRYWHLDAEQEHWLRMSIALCPQLQESVNNLSTLLAMEKRFDEAIALVQQAQLDDPRNEMYAPMLTGLIQAKDFGREEAVLRAKLGRTPQAAYDVQLNLQLAEILEGEGKLGEAYDKLRLAAGLTNWDRAGMAGIVQHYVDQVHDPEAAIAFLQVREKIDPKSSEMVYSLAALEAMMNHKDEAMKYLAEASLYGGTNAIVSARIDPRFQTMQDDPRFEALLKISPTNAPAMKGVPPLLTPSNSAKPTPKK